MSNNESSVVRCPVCSMSSPTPSNPISLTSPPSFGDFVRCVLGGPLMVVVDSVELPPDAPRHASTAVFYLDDCGAVQSARLPWALLCAFSPAALDEERSDIQRLLESDYYAREAARMSARLQSLRKELEQSNDPASSFSSIRAAVMSLLQTGYEVDHRGSPSTVAAEDACPPTSPSSELAGVPFVDATSHQREVLGKGDSYCGHTGSADANMPAVSSDDDPGVLTRYQTALDVVSSGPADTSVVWRPGHTHHD